MTTAAVDTGSAQVLGRSVGAETDEILEHISCPLCESQDSQLHLLGRDRLFGLPGQYPVVRCRGCGLQYVNPRPSLASLGRHYPDDYFPSRLPGTMHPLVRRLSGILIGMRWIKYIRRVEGVIGRIPASARVVDVGCGTNEFLRRLQKVRGSHGVGVDFKPETVAYIRNQLQMQAIQGTLLEAQLPTGSVDLVTMNEYFEHEPEPRRVLTEARRISKTGAHLIIEVPYCGGLAARMFRSYWSQLDVPRHLAFYTPTTLADILQRSGYRLLHAVPFAAPFSIGLSVLQALGYNQLGKMRPREVLSIALVGTLLLPLFPFFPEFMFAVARAE